MEDRAASGTPTIQRGAMTDGATVRTNATLHSIRESSIVQSCGMRNYLRYANHRPLLLCAPSFRAAEGQHLDGQHPT